MKVATHLNRLKVIAQHKVVSRSFFGSSNKDSWVLSRDYRVRLIDDDSLTLEPSSPWGAASIFTMRDKEEFDRVEFMKGAKLAYFATSKAIFQRDWEFLSELIANDAAVEEIRARIPTMPEHFQQLLNQSEETGEIVYNDLLISYDSSAVNSQIFAQTYHKIGMKGWKFMGNPQMMGDIQKVQEKHGGKLEKSTMQDLIDVAWHQAKDLIFTANLRFVQSGGPNADWKISKLNYFQ